MSDLDVRTLPPSERHGRIHGAFEELDPGETLTIINDHDPKPLYYELAAEVPAFDADGYEMEREGAERYVAELPKAEGDDLPEAEIARIADLDGEPHADAFPGLEPKAIRLSLEAGERVPEHEHPDHTVLFHVLAGAVDVVLDGESHLVEGGEILRFEGEAAVEPTAREESVALVVLAPRPEA